MQLRFKPATLAAAALLCASAAFATGNTSDAADWRFAPGQLFNGVAALDGTARLLFTAASNGGGYACSGSLLQGGMYVLTAAHCADDLAAGSMTVQFGLSGGAASVTRTVGSAAGDVTIHPGWQGFQSSGDRGIDMAIVRLNAPVTTIQGYGLSTTNDVGKTYLMGGYGTTGRGSAAEGPGWTDSSYGHYGYNTFDVDSKTFNQAVNTVVSGWGYDPSFYVGTTYMSDFDNPNGAAANNTLGRIAAVTGHAWNSGTGLGAGEALIAGGDSGGGDFIWNGSEWLLSAVHSWGWQGNGTDGACTSVGLLGCDTMTDNAASYGDLSGSTAVFGDIGWIQSVTAVPEPGSCALMLAGLASTVAAARRRRAAA